MDRIAVRRRIMTKQIPEKPTIRPGDFIIEEYSDGTTKMLLCIKTTYNSGRYYTGRNRLETTFVRSNPESGKFETLNWAFSSWNSFSRVFMNALICRV